MCVTILAYTSKSWMPQVFGPFESEAQAEKWIDAHSDGKRRFFVVDLIPDTDDSTGSTLLLTAKPR
jgi:hypothetical protein